MKWTKKPYSLSKTEAVVTTLLQHLREYGGFEYCVWLDNLFASSRLLRTLRDIGFGAAGTVRTQDKDGRGLSSDLLVLKRDFADTIQ